MADTPAKETKSDQASLERAILACHRGMTVRGVAQVKERGPSTFDGKTSERMILEAMGFSQTYYARDGEEKNWPKAGDFVQVEIPMQRSPTGQYRLGMPNKMEVIATES